MIEPGVIEKLKTYTDSSLQILSVYLGADTTQAPTGDFLEKQFHSLLHDNINKHQRNMFEYDIERINEYLKEYKPSGRTLVFFSAGENLWQVINLEFSLSPKLSIDNSPNIDPLLQAKSRYSEYMVLMTDREKTRMFTVEQGEITEYSEYEGSFVPQRASSTGKGSLPSQIDVNFRRIEKSLDERLKLSAHAVVEFAKHKNIHFIILGGHKEMFKRVAESLPIDLRSKIVGNFVTEIDLPLNEILAKSKIIADEYNNI